MLVYWSPSFKELFKELYWGNAKAKGTKKDPKLLHMWIRALHTTNERRSRLYSHIIKVYCLLALVKV